MQTTRVRAAAAIAASLTITSSAAACGSDASDNDDAEVASLDGSSDEPTGEATATSAGGDESFQDAILAFAECMRGEGIDVDDPQFDTDGRPIVGDDSGGGGAGGTGLLGLDPDDPEVAAAQDKCESELEGVSGEFTADPEQAAQRQESLLAFAECMRDHGIDFPDPQFDADGRPVVNEGGGGPGAIFGDQQDDPEFATASDECQQQLADDGLTGPRGDSADTTGSDDG